jgi:hypothetical protein
VIQLAERQMRSRFGSATFDASGQLQAIRESAKRGADARQSPLEHVASVESRDRSVPEHRPDRDFHDLGVEYVDFGYKGPEELRAAAETSFRLATGPVSSRLVDELEALGKPFSAKPKRLKRLISEMRSRPTRITRRSWNASI